MSLILQSKIRKEKKMLTHMKETYEDIFLNTIYTDQFFNHIKSEFGELCIEWIQRYKFFIQNSVFTPCSQYWFQECTLVLQRNRNVNLANIVVTFSYPTTFGNQTFRLFYALYFFQNAPSFQEIILFYSLCR